MRVLILCFMAGLMAGCASPRYQTVYRYEPPAEAAGRACLAQCEQQLVNCQTQCRTVFEACMKAAEPVVEQRLAEAQKKYAEALEDYAFALQRYELYLWMNWHHGGLWYDPWPMPYAYPGPAPRPPSRDVIVAQVRKEQCVEDCGCLPGYDACYLTCGGRKIPEQQCVANCPAGTAAATAVQENTVRTPVQP